MTASFGITFIVGLLVLIPFSFIGAGRDTERSYASRIQRQREATLEWTDKDILALEHTDLQREYYGEPSVEEGTPCAPQLPEGMLPQFAA